MAKRQSITRTKVRVSKISEQDFELAVAAGKEVRALRKRLDEVTREVGWTARFFGLLDVRGPDECWMWNGHRQECGHGRFQTDKFEKSGAHQIAYLLLRGPIPDGLHVCHSCDNPPCCNPAHLWLGTNKENIMDCVRKGRNFVPVSLPEMKARGERAGLAKYTELQVREIRASTELARVIAARIGCSRQNIYEIRNRKTWRHI